MHDFFFEYYIFIFLFEEFQGFRICSYEMKIQF